MLPRRCQNFHGAYPITPLRHRHKRIILDDMVQVNDFAFEDESENENERLAFSHDATRKPMRDNSREFAAQSTVRPWA